MGHHDAVGQGAAPVFCNLPMRAPLRKRRGLMHVHRPGGMVRDDSAGRFFAPVVDAALMEVDGEITIRGLGKSCYVFFDRGVAEARPSDRRDIFALHPRSTSERGSHGE